MDDLTLALTLAGKTKTTEEKTKAINPSSASIIYMVAVTASTGGSVVLKDEIESSSEWEEGDYIEIDDDGDFEEYESEDDELEDVDDGIIDMTDGDGADIEETDEESVSFSVAEYQIKAQETYALEEIEEIDATEDTIPGEDASISDEIDDGDAEELPDDGESSEEDEIPDENTVINEATDEEYTLTDDNSDDESDDPVDGAELSDGYTVADCIGTIKAGDRVAVMVQDGNITVLGVVGSGDEQAALTEQASEAAEEANIAASNAQTSADNAKTQADAAATQAANAEKYASNAYTEAQEAVQKATDASTKAYQVALDLSEVNKEVSTVKEDAAQLRSDMEDEIEIVKTTMSTDYATKNEVSETETTLRAEFKESVTEIKTTFAQDYAKKSEVEGAVTEVEANLQTQITQNANEILSTAKSVEDIKVDITEQDGKIANAIQTANNAQTVANNAKTDAQEAQEAADAAQTAADAANTAASNAQTAADAAKADLATAQAKLEEVENTVGASQEDIAEAQQAVENAQAAADSAQAAADTAKAKADEAQITANEAQTSASNANVAANNAQKAADEAKEDLKALEDRVITAETKIIQNSEEIKLMATKAEVTETLSGYYTKEEADAAIQVKADAITSSVSSTYATNTALATTDSKADNAQRAADAVQAEVDTLKIDVTTNYATKSELTQTSDSILASVEGAYTTKAETSTNTQALQALIELKLDKDKLVSEINASADIITLSGNRFVVNSDYFNLTEDGTLTAVNGVFTNAAVEGKLTAEIEKSDYITKKGTVEVGVVGIRIYDGDPINYTWVGLPGLSTSAGGVAGASAVISQHGIHFRNRDTDASITSSVAISNFDTPYVKVRGEDWALYLGEVIKLNNSIETYFSVSATGAIKGHSISPVETGLYACGLDDARWSTVYTCNINANAKATLAGQVWMTGVADESFQTVQTYAANMYIGTSGRVWKRASSSSKEIKHDIRKLESSHIAAERLLDVKVVQFKYNDGVIAKSDQRYNMDLPGFIIEDLDDKYPICIDKQSECKKEWSWNAQYLIPGMLRLEQLNNEKLLELVNIENVNAAKFENIDYTIEQLFMRLAELEKQNELLKKSLAV